MNRKKLPEPYSTLPTQQENPKPHNTLSTPVENLWKEYHFAKTRKKKTKYRNRLIEQYMPLVRKIALYIQNCLNLPPSVTLEEIISDGTIGLIDAVEKYKSHLNGKFKTYAGIRIKGAIIDGIRKLDYLPRTTRARIKKINNFRETTMQAKGREPSDEEIADEFSLNPEQMTRANRANRFTNINSIGPFNKITENHIHSKKSPCNTHEQKPDQLEFLIEKEKVNFMANELANLSETERLIIILYYFDRLLMKEIGRMVHTSESRVSQMHKEILKKLHRRFRKL